MVNVFKKKKEMKKVDVLCYICVYFNVFIVLKEIERLVFKVQERN